MAIRKHGRVRDTQLEFEVISIEGGLLSPEWLSKVAQLAAGNQTEADYRIAKGLNLRDEIGRFWRIAQAHWKEFAVGLAAKAGSSALAERFVAGLLSESFGFGSLNRSQPIVIAERTYPLGFTALDTRVPVVIAPAASDIDALSPLFGDEGRRRSAFGLAQEFLNAAENSQWGLVSDGVILRVLRDNASLTRPAWIEADLRRIFMEERYADFAALWLLLHETRFGRDGQSAAECPLEIWREAGKQEGTRAREHLRRGVEDALVALGQGFVAHPDNQALRSALRSGSLSTPDYFSQLLRLVYRLIFLLTVEERKLLHPPATPDGARDLYAQGYSLQRLRDKSVKRSAHDRFSDLWESTKVVLRGLASGEPSLGLPALAGIFAKNQCPHLDVGRLENRALLLAMFKLAWLKEDGALARVNWRDMGPEELGSVYESLLELVPQVLQEGRQFGFATGDETKGNARKTTGSYYTPDSLVQVLLDSALEPAIADTVAGNPDNPVDALLRLSIVDPACGSGHFLLAAARRLAAHVARLQANGTPSGAEYRHALRQVVGRCIYGVDLNLMAVELCKVSLWMEAVEPGLPLTFLNSHIQHGNALLGTTPVLMTKGVPDAAWEPIEGDDRKVASALKKRNKQGTSGQRSFETLWTSSGDKGAEAVTKAVSELESASDANALELANKEAKWETILGSAEYRQQKFVADAWCAAFVWPKQLGPLSEAAPTNELWRQLRDRQGQSPELTTTTVEALCHRYRFFQWHLQFPQVFAKGGFDVVLGNPPWERVKLQEQEFFASKSEEIAAAANAAARKKLIANLATENPQLSNEWREGSRKAEGESHFIRQSARYPLCGKGDVNTYAIFAELNLNTIGPKGRAGFIVPSGIATDETTKDYFSSLARDGRLASLYDFRNHDGLFYDVGHRRFKFCLMTVLGKATAQAKATFVFFAESAAHTCDPKRQFSLTSAQISLLNPNSGTCPTFRSARDADINTAIYQRSGILWRNDEPSGNHWNLRFMAMFHMAGDSGLFKSRAEVESTAFKLHGSRWVGKSGAYLPLIEAKMVHHFDHRYGDYADRPSGSLDSQLPDVPLERLNNPAYRPLPRYWVAETEVATRIRGLQPQGWFLGWRDICRSTDERTLIAAVVPAVAVGHTTPLMFTEVDPCLVACLYASLCSFILDYAVRQKVGGTHLTYSFLKQLPVFAPVKYGERADWAPETLIRAWILPRVLELTYTAWDLEPFARDIGHYGAPFHWNPERRFLLRCELDAAFFHLYGLSRQDIAFVMEAFPIVRKHDEKIDGTYRTKSAILEIYDALAESTRTGQAYQTRLTPIPASFRCTHLPRLPSNQRVALASEDKFLVSFVYAFLRQTRDEATFDLLDSVFHLLRHRARHMDEFTAALGDAAQPWLSSFNDKLPNNHFVPFLKRLEADGWITANRHTGQLRITEKFPAVPFDAWRNFDVSAALCVIAQQPEVVRLILKQPDTPLASCEFAIQKTG